MQLGPKTQAALAHYRQLKAIESEMGDIAEASDKAVDAWDAAALQHGKWSKEAKACEDAFARLSPMLVKYQQLRRDIACAHASLTVTLLSEH